MNDEWERQNQERQKHPATQTDIDRILSNAKEEAYKILEVDKYPEINDVVDETLKNTIAEEQTLTVADYEALAKRFVDVAKKAADRFIKAAVTEVYNNWNSKHSDELRESRSENLSYKKLKPKKDAALEILSRMNNGELTPEKAYAEMKSLITGRGKKNSSTEQATAVKSNDLQTFTTKENPFLGMEFKNLEIKSSYDGRQILYRIDGKRASRDEYERVAFSQAQKKAQILIKKFEAATGIESFDSANHYVKIQFPSKTFVKVSFETEQDAVKFARYVYSHFDGIEKISAMNDSFSIGDSGETFHDKYISENTTKDANKTISDIADSYRPEVEKVRGNYESPFNCSVNIHWQLQYMVFQKLSLRHTFIKTKDMGRENPIP